MSRFGPALLAALLCSAAPLAAKEAPDRGVNFFLRGRLDSAIAFYAKALQDNPADARAKEILANCLVIKGKEDILGRRFAQGRAALERALEMAPAKSELKMLVLYSELDEQAPTASLSVSTVALDASAEKAAVFDCFFGNGECARGGRYTVHIVQEGETMAGIAIKYYGYYTLWEKIWKANPQLSNPHRLEKGVKLLIPQDK